MNHKTSTNSLKALPEWAFVCVLLCCVFLFHFLIGLQGLDLSDEGWLLSGYQQIFRHPQSVESMFYIYDTLLIGGIWDSLFNGSVISFRILSSLCLTGIAALVYRLSREYVNRWIILICLAATMISRAFVQVFHYNYSSSLLILIITYFIYFALQKNNLYYMLCAGIVTGISFFFRFPNISFCGLIIILLPYYFQTRNGIRTLQLLGMALCGCIIGIATNILLILILGHQDAMLSMLSITFSFTTDGDSTHNIPSMLAIYLTQYKDIFYTMGLLLFIPFILWWNEIYENNKTIKYLILFSALGVLFAMVAYIFHHGQVCHYLYFYYAFCCLVFILYFICRRRWKKELLYLMTLSICILFIMPIGSDGGVYNVGAYCVYLPFCITAGIVWDEIKRITNKNLRNVYSVALIGSICVAIIVSLHTLSYTCYRDRGMRIYKTSTLTNSKIHTTYTNYNKAQKLDSLLIHLYPLVDDDSELISYPSAPGLNYLTRTKPYLNAPWTGIINYSVFEMELEKAEYTKKKPIIVLVKASDANWYSPNPYWSSILDCNDGHPAINEKNQLLADFMKRHHYKKYYEDTCFQVQIPE